LKYRYFPVRKVTMRIGGLMGLIRVWRLHGGPVAFYLIENVVVMDVAVGAWR